VVEGSSHEAGGRGGTHALGAVVPQVHLVVLREGGREGGRVSKTIKLAIGAVVKEEGREGK
jgi:hypothetical protein